MKNTMAMDDFFILPFCPTTLCHSCSPVFGVQITVSNIPEYDPTGLPFWEIYVKEGKSNTIRVGGTLAGNFVGTWFCRRLID
jgi:hypothetical protein